MVFPILLLTAFFPQPDRQVVYIESKKSVGEVIFNTNPFRKDTVIGSCQLYTSITFSCLCTIALFSSLEVLNMAVCKAFRGFHNTNRVIFFDLVNCIMAQYPPVYRAAISCCKADIKRRRELHKIYAKKKDSFIWVS